MTLPTNSCVHIPPGFRFHPTDEELINFYLKKKVSSEKYDLDCIIPDVDLNRFEPWDICERCNMDIMYLSESYFFNRTEKKFLIGKRTNRATTAGFWKATGKDKPIYSGCHCIGMKKTLVFYKGRAPHSEKTDWIMHEYRLKSGDSGLPSNEDGWVVCHIFKKHNVQGKMDQSCSNLLEEEQFGNVGNVESSRNSQENFALGHALLCKKEIVECPPQVAFLKLPQLESAKTAPNLLCRNYDNLTRTLDEDQEVVQEPAFSLGGPSIKGFYSEPVYMPEDAGYVNRGLLTDKNVFENFGTDLPDLSNFTGGILHCPHSIEQLLSECSSTCEVQLWNF